MCIATMQMHLHLLGGCNCPDWKPWSSALLRSCILLLVLVVGKTLFGLCRCVSRAGPGKSGGEGGIRLNLKWGGLVQGEH